MLQFCSEYLMRSAQNSIKKFAEVGHKEVAQVGFVFFQFFDGLVKTSRI